MKGDPDQGKKIALPDSEAEIQRIVQKYSPAIVQKAFVRALEDDGDDLLRSCLAIVMSSQRSNVRAADRAKVLDGEVVCHDIFGESLKEWASDTRIDLSEMPTKRQKVSS